MAKTNLADLPDDVRRLIAPHAAEGQKANDQMLDAIGVAIASKRLEATTARKSSGIEDTWLACEQAYAGIDDANRNEYANNKWTKSMSLEGPVQTGGSRPRSDHKSTAFVRLTARYVDAGAAKLGEILLPIDDKAFSFTETPVPELIKGKDDPSPVAMDNLPGSPIAMRPAKPGEVPTGPVAAPLSPGVPPVPVAAPAVGAVPPAGAVAPAKVPVRVKDLAEETIEIARKKAKAAEKRIYDWHVECNRTAEVRKVIADACRIGVGVLKGPFPKASRSMATRRTEGSIELQIIDKIQPASKWVDAWNFYPDPACGEDIHSGEYVFECDWLSERRVRGLKKLPGYIVSQIDQVIKEGPDKVNTQDSGRPDPDDKKKGQFQTWYYHGTLSREDMDCICQASGKPLTKDDVPEDQEQVHAIVTMINDCVIRATINPLDSGCFPYHAMPWQRRSGSWAGIGVAEQIRVPQRMVNASTRAMLNNAGISAGGQIVVDLSVLTPADGSTVITPNKVWYKKPDSAGDDVRKAFEVYEFANATPELQSIIQLGMQMAEESTSIPLITQGQSGPTTPDTFGAAQLQNNNANQLLRSIGYAFDDYITEPEVRMYYEYLILDPEVPDDEKGDFEINAHGSAALVERAIQDQTIAQLLPLSVQMPALGLDPKKTTALYLKSKRIDPTEAQYTKEELDAQASQPPPAAPQIEAANIRAAVERERIAADTADTQADNAREDRKLLTQSTVTLHELQLKREIAAQEREIEIYKLVNASKISMEDAKVILAKTAMTLEAQERMSGIKASGGSSGGSNGGGAPRSARRIKPQRPAPQVAVALAEPAGRAPPGQAFQA